MSPRDPTHRPWWPLLAATVVVLVLAACGSRTSAPGDAGVAFDDAQVQGDGQGAAEDRSSADPETGTGPGEQPGEGSEGAAASGGSGQEAAASSGGSGQSTAEQPARQAGHDLSARTARGTQTAEARDPHDPVAVKLPSIGVTSRLVRLGLQPDRTMEVPDDFSLAGWYVHAPQPGDVGPAVIAGHVDSRSGPAVFYRLHELEPGDPVLVRRADGEVVTFVVERIEQHPKDAFPTEAVYGNTEQPELRLITCGGEFDRRARSHRDNIIAFATIAQ